MQLKLKKKKICAVCDRLCQKWFAKFRAGDFSLDDAPQSGRPVEVDNDQIETLIENNQCYTMWEIADILKTSKSIKLLLKMKNVSCILRKKLNRLFGQPNIKLGGGGGHLARPACLHSSPLVFRQKDAPSPHPATPAPAYREGLLT